MRRVTANYVLTPDGLRAGVVVELDSSGVISSVVYPDESIDSCASLEFFGGILVAGFVLLDGSMESLYNHSSRPSETLQQRLEISRAWETKLYLEGVVAMVDSSPSGYIEAMGTTKIEYISGGNTPQFAHLSVADRLKELTSTLPLTTAIEQLTIVAAQRAGIASWAGSIEQGKRSGVVLIDGVDLSTLQPTKNLKTLKL